MARKINLLYSIGNLMVGGAQEVVKNLAAHIDRDRYNVVVATHEGRDEADEPLAAELRGLGVEVVNVPMISWADRGEREGLVRFLIERRIDVAHSHLYPADLWTSRLARTAGVPVIVYSKHDTYKKKSLPVRIVRALKYNYNADLAIATSELTRQHLLCYEMMLPWKVRVAPNPVDTGYFDPARFSGEGVRREFGIPPDAPVVGNISRLVGRKGVDSFVETCRRVKEEMPGCRFLLVGDGYKADDIKRQVSSLNIGDFIFAGTRRDLGELMSAMDVFLFTPYWGEALPLVVLEAMAMEKAIVASNVCSNNELIEHGVTGLLPSPRRWKKGVSGLDAGLLAGAVTGLLKDPDKRRRFGETARKSVAVRFGVQAVMRNIESIYEEMLRKKGVI